jgi:hypothetical protein
MPTAHLNLVMVGDSKQGKTALSKRHLYNRFDKAPHSVGSRSTATSATLASSQSVASFASSRRNCRSSPLRSKGSTIIAEKVGENLIPAPSTNSDRVQRLLSIPDEGDDAAPAAPPQLTSWTVPESTGLPRRASAATLPPPADEADSQVIKGPSPNQEIHADSEMSFLSGWSRSVQPSDPASPVASPRGRVVVSLFDTPPNSRPCTPDPVEAIASRSNSPAGLFEEFLPATGPPGLHERVNRCESLLEVSQALMDFSFRTSSTWIGAELRQPLRVPSRQHFENLDGLLVVASLRVRNNNNLMAREEEVRIIDQQHYLKTRLAQWLSGMRKRRDTSAAPWFIVGTMWDKNTAIDPANRKLPPTKESCQLFLDMIVRPAAGLANVELCLDGSPKPGAICGVFLTSARKSWGITEMMAHIAATGKKWQQERPNTVPTESTPNSSPEKDPKAVNGRTPGSDYPAALGSPKGGRPSPSLLDKIVLSLFRQGTEQGNGEDSNAAATKRFQEAHSELVGHRKSTKPTPQATLATVNLRVIMPLAAIFVALVWGLLGN